MNITAAVRRNTLELLNVSEAARRLGIDVQQMHRWLKAGELPRPEITLGRRRYYRASELAGIAKEMPRK